jgi:hypothetical protein
MRKHVMTFVILLLSGASIAAQHPTMPPGMSHEEHLRQLQKDQALKQRGAVAMGFDQDQADHHFVLRPNGGEIAVTAKVATDAKTIGEIRSHFREIAESFAAGIFDKPLATHDEMPPGAATLAANRSQVRYAYQERPDGASVVIETDDAATIAAIHVFLRYQIVEHKTGDPLIVKQ